eukprot:359540-Chlamydomonas_euryale.AAC.9
MCVQQNPLLWGGPACVRGAESSQDATRIMRGSFRLPLPIAVGFCAGDHTLEKAAKRWQGKQPPASKVL